MKLFADHLNREFAMEAMDLLVKADIPAEFRLLRSDPFGRRRSDHYAIFVPEEDCDRAKELLGLDEDYPGPSDDPDDYIFPDFAAEDPKPDRTRYVFLAFIASLLPPYPSFLKHSLPQPLPKRRTIAAVQRSFASQIQMTTPPRRSQQRTPYNKPSPHHS